jgi:hypothetical protein
VHHYRSALPALALTAMALLAGCSPAPTEPATLPTGIVVDYQLGGAYDPADAVGGVVRDASNPPALGLYSVCYLNGFQTQPADRALWLEDRADLVLTADGEPVIDENWPDELILDISTAERRERIAGLQEEAIRGCAASGFDAVEFDNLDSYTRSAGAFDVDDALDLAARLARISHDAGLAVAQKNSQELGTRGRDEAGFDFVVAEECHRFSECAEYAAVYGEAVIDIEYSDDLRGAFADVCADPATPRSTVMRDRDLLVPSDPDYVFESC